jgi:hypothetical protein
VVTQNAHGLQNGDEVEITNIVGNTAANGIFTVANRTTNTFELSGSVGNGAYVSGGNAQKISTTSIEVDPFTFYKFFLNWNYSTRTVTLHLGSYSSPAVLTLSGLVVGTVITTNQLGTNFKIGMMAGADITGLGFLGINYNAPVMITNRY